MVSYPVENFSVYCPQPYETSSHVSHQDTIATMDFMITLSLLLNVAVLVPVCGGLLANAKWAVDVYGNATPARGILLSVYIAIGLISLLLLVLHDPKPTAALLLVQVVYKVLTPLTVGRLTNPVVISNLCIAAFHAVTLFLIWQELSKLAR
jgi:hypothetical protein